MDMSSRTEAIQKLFSSGLALTSEWIFLKSSYYHSNLEDVLIEKKIPKRSDNKFIKYTVSAQIKGHSTMDGSYYRRV